MMTGAKKFQEPTDEEIARYAYHLWECEGCVHGRDMDYWLQAKAHLTSTREYEAGLLKAPGFLQKTSAKKADERAASIASEDEARPSKKRRARATREPIYA